MSSETQDYNELLKSYKHVQTELESVKQTLHECRRQMKTTQTLEAEYQDEIKMLHTQGTLEQQKLELQLRQLEEDKISLKATHVEQISCLERELTSKEDEIQELKKEIEEIVRITESQKPAVEVKLVDEIAELKQQHVGLCSRLNELEKELEESERQNLTAEETIRDLQEELENYQEIVKCKKEELEEANILIQNLKDDYLCVKAELDAVRSRPLDDQSKGNSLFAEVDDRRVQLQQNMNAMKSQYVEMKREKASYLRQISALRNENTTLIVKYQKDIEDKKTDDEMILDSYKSHIQTLNEIIESHKKELKEKERNLEEMAPNQAIKFLDDMLAIKNEEIEEMRKTLSGKSLNYMTLTYDLAEANRQIRRSNLEIMQLKNEIGELQNELEKMKMVSPSEKTPTLEAKLPKSIVKSVNSADLTETNNENENTVNRKVQFNESTNDPHVTERKKGRKGAKMMVLKPKIYE